MLAALVLASPASIAEAFLLGGIQVHEKDHARWIAALRASGMNTVEATVYAFQGNWDEPHLWWNDEEPAVVDEIRRAKRAGLHVVLVLRLALDHAFPKNRFLWHGQVLPATEQDVDAWFARYREFVLKWAALAEREGVDVLALGSEMKALTGTVPLSRIGYIKTYHGFRYYQRFLRKRTLRFADELQARHLVADGSGAHRSVEAFADARRTANVRWAREAYQRQGPRSLRRVNRKRARLLDNWRALIADARAVYRGKLTYAANFDHYDQVAFWDDLDLIGINSYFSLRPHLDRELSGGELSRAFETAWSDIFERVDRWRERSGVSDRPLLLTEIGFTFRRHSTVEPWNHQGFAVVGWKTHKRRLVVWREQPVDYEERDRAMRALLEIHRRDPSRLAGLLWWKLSSDAAHEAIEPFVLHIGADSEDPLVDTLSEFAAEP